MPDIERHTPKRVLVAGSAAGPVMALDEPLSFWGGLDSETGRIIDHHHPQIGQCVAGTILVMRAGRGSSSASSVLAEAIRLGTSPAAIVLLELDEIIVIGALVADELYGIVVHVLVVDEPTFGRIASASSAVIDSDGGITIEI
ncbi:MAG TPA: DUF126 domain-containing protein [Actinobacteria bacterium]|nr:DUF126 domain-containing protein [Actinomycetota bacterium]